MGIDIVVAFFFLGALSVFIRSPIEFPSGAYKGLSLYLMLAIGLKGGVALSEHIAPILLIQSIGVISLGLVIPLIAFPILMRVGKLDRLTASSIAAHYGSVSVGTYAVAIAVLESMQIAYEQYFPMFVVLLEMPAILVGIALAKAAGGEKDVDRKALLHEITCNQGVVLMLGALIIGFMAGPDGAATVMPLFKTIFHGALALFLLEMGIVAAQRAKEIKTNMLFLVAFGTLMPLVGATLGGAMGMLLSLSMGGVILLAVLAASASYIAVPAVMRAAVPSANNGMAIATSLGITFPFNVMIGIPLYVAVAKAVVG